MSISIIIPVKNEEQIIIKTLKKFEESWIVEVEHEILIINDNSNDKTVDLIENTKFEKLNIILKNNPKIGLGSAITIAIDNSSKEFVSIYMADMSDSLEDLKIYYETIKKNNLLDAIFGSRFIKNAKVVNYPKFKFFINRFANNFIKVIFFSKYNDFTNAFKIYKRSTLL